MRRREFITLLGGATAAWPLVVSAQQAHRIRRVAVLMVYAEDDSGAKSRVHALESALPALGWMKGQNIQLDYWWSPGDQAALRKDAAELVSEAPDLILASGTSVLSVVRELTKSIPILFIGVSDPEGAGFVKNLAQPGGNLTGFTNFEPAISGKWLEILKEVAPHVTRVTWGASAFSVTAIRSRDFFRCLKH
jgi:putative ABC transport system substrate-binding protein